MSEEQIFLGRIRQLAIEKAEHEARKAKAEADRSEAELNAVRSSIKSIQDSMKAMALPEIPGSN